MNEPDSKETDQGATLAFMDQSVRSGAAKRIDTHASIVFLEDDRVLKIKRAVRLPFLDYSTLERTATLARRSLRSTGTMRRSFTGALSRSRTAGAAWKSAAAGLQSNGPWK